MPISIGTRSRGVMQLAGELADVALVGVRDLSPATAATYRAWLAEGAARAGRDAGSIEVAPRLTLCVSSDGALARRSVKRYVAHYLVVAPPADLDIEPDRFARLRTAIDVATGWYFDTDRYDPPEIDELVDDDLVARFAIAGTPEECVAPVVAAAGLGFDSVSLNLAPVCRPGASMYDGLRETIEGAARVREAL